MNLNPFSFLPSLNTEPEIDEAQAKADRIKFHREHVRNGPTSFKSTTNGQIRRAKARDIQRGMKKTRRRQVQTYLAAEREAAVLRAHLQHIGLVPFGSDHRPHPQMVLASATWIIRHFAEDQSGTGKVEVTPELVNEAVRSAYARWGDIIGVPSLRVPADYELPVGFAA